MQNFFVGEGGGGWNNDKSHLPVKVHSIEPAVLSNANDCGLRKMLLGNVVAKAVSRCY